MTAAARKGLALLWSVTMGTLVLFVVFYLLESLGGADPRRYRSRSFVTDLLYRYLYAGGIYRLFIYAPVAALLRTFFTLPTLSFLSRGPAWLTIPLALLVPDFITYWYHRFEHSRWWWRFHQVHHSQEHLTFATTARHHPLEFLLNDSITIVLLVLGAPTFTWLPYRLFSAFQGPATHAQLHWEFGPLRYVLVSPVFHSIHHTRERASADTNFGAVFSCWDYLFGTASAQRVRPERTGVEHAAIPENILLQIAMPVASLFRTRPIA